MKNNTMTDAQMEKVKQSVNADTALSDKDKAQVLSTLEFNEKVRKKHFNK